MRLNMGGWRAAGGSVGGGGGGVCVCVLCVCLCVCVRVRECVCDGTVVRQVGKVP